MSRCLALLGVFCFTVSPIGSLYGETVISETGPVFTDLTIGPNTPAAISWISASPFSNVSITAHLTSFTTPGQTGNAYLTTQIGPGTTVANQIATSPFVFPTSYGDPIVLTGLSLPAGTFYLTLVATTDGANGGNAWLGGDAVNPPPPTLASGVTFNGQYYASSGNAYAPASNFAPITFWNSPLLFVVTGDQVIPEPSALALFIVGAIAFAFILRFSGRPGRPKRSSIR